MSRKEYKVLGCTRHLSVEVWFRFTSGVPQFEFELIPAKLPQCYLITSSPIFFRPNLSQIRLELGPKFLEEGRAACHRVTEGCKSFPMKGSHLQQLWPSHTMASILSALPRRPTDQLETEHNVQSLNHQWWISLDSGKHDHSWKSVKLNRHAGLIQLTRDRKQWASASTSSVKSHSPSLVHGNSFSRVDIDHTCYL